MDDHPPTFLSALSKDVTKRLYFNLPTFPRLSSRCLTHPPTIVQMHDKVGMNGVPYYGQEESERYVTPMVGAFKIVTKRYIW